MQALRIWWFWNFRPCHDDHDVRWNELKRGDKQWYFDLWVAGLLCCSATVYLDLLDVSLLLADGFVDLPILGWQHMESFTFLMLHCCCRYFHVVSLRFPQISNESPWNIIAIYIYYSYIIVFWMLWRSPMKIGAKSPTCVWQIARITWQYFLARSTLAQNWRKDSDQTIQVINPKEPNQNCATRGRKFSFKQIPIFNTK